MYCVTKYHPGRGICVTKYLIYMCVQKHKLMKHNNQSLSLTKEGWERWKFGQTDECHHFAADECADEEGRDAKQVSSWKTLILCDRPDHSKEHCCQKDWRRESRMTSDYKVMACVTIVFVMMRLIHVFSNRVVIVNLSNFFSNE